MQQPTRWWLIRHAPVINPEGKVYGGSEIDCDTTNTAVFQAVAASLPKDAVWICSPLSRTRRTAAALLEAGASGEEMQLEPRLVEQNFGDWQGRNRQEILAQWPEQDKQFWLAPAHERAPGGESFLDVRDRVAEALADWNAKARGRDIIAVMHGGSIRAALSIALDLAPERALSFHTETVSVTGLDAYPGGSWGVRFVNSCPGRD